MPALISYDPTGATFSPITPAQYAQLLAAMKSDSSVTKLTPTSCTAQGLVDFTWQYDGATSIHIIIVGKHGKAHFAPNSAIFDKLRDEFFSQL